MRYPKLKIPVQRRETTSTFGGFNANVRIGDREFSQMKNLTSDRYPTVSPRNVRTRHAVLQNGLGLIARDTLCYIDGSFFVMDGYRVDLGLDDSPKSLVSMGAYVVIFPDKKYINTVDLTDFGNLEAHFSAGTATVCPCTASGDAAVPDFVGASEPASPQPGQTWLDTSITPNALKQWSASSLWAEMGASYCAISTPNIGKSFRENDTVTLSGLGQLDGAASVVKAEDDCLVVVGLLDGLTEITTPFTVSRTVPEMDFVIENGNRLWGCRYGLNSNGEIVNELYASALGDFRNWNSFQGLSTDSYQVSLGSDGRFTGAISHLGYPLFFKADCLHKIYGNAPSSFQLQTTPCRGVENGSSQSLAIVGETLYYKSPAGICAYDGSLPRDISSQLGKTHYGSAIAAALGSKYYLSMLDDDGNSCLFVYDTARTMWHIEDDFRPLAMTQCRGSLFAIDSTGREILNLTGGSGEPAEESVDWFAVTGSIGGGLPDTKYLTALQVRLSMEEGTRVNFALRYDSKGPWEPAGSLTGTGLGSFCVPIRPRRCDHLHLKISGRGPMQIYAITRSMESGGEPL